MKLGEGRPNLKLHLKLHEFIPNLGLNLGMAVLSSLIGCCLTAPARAGQITNWHFDANQNQFEFTTDEAVQPRAQLLPNSAQLVIDLPGTRSGQAAVTQEIGGTVQRVRISEFDAQTTRIVVEMTPGYTLDPQQIRFRGLSATQWAVQLPKPQLVSPSAVVAPSSSPNSPSAPVSATPAATPASTARPEPARNQTPRRSTSSAQTPQSSPQVAQISNLQVTDAGLLLSLQGAPQVSVDRSRSGRRVTVRLENARIASGLSTEARQIDQHGVNELKLRQRSGNVVELELQVDRRSPDWQIRSDQSHLLLSPEAELTVAAKAADPVPPANSASRPVTSSATRPASLPTGRSTGRPASAQPAPMQVAEQPSPARLIAPTRQMATVQGISLDVSSSQLVIQTDRPVSHSAQWQGGMYVVTLSPAQLARQVSGPQFAATDPLRRVQLRQVDSDTVKISIQPATGVQFGELNAVTSQMLALQLQRATATRPTNRGNSSLPSIIPNGRIVVAIDPGHGGNDPGAVGIGGIQEADIVLAIGRQVARLLEQSGVQAVLTRSDDTEIDLQPRVDTAEQVNANLFVSIHANSMGMERPDVNGLETYYYSSGAALAQTIQNSMVSSLGMEDRGVRQARFYVIRNTTMPSVLVETGFVTGSDDAPRLASAAYQTQMATAIARGILQYIQQNSITGSR